MRKKKLLLLFLLFSRAFSTGLVNLGNTCYQNGVLQALRSINPLVDFLLDPKNIKYYNMFNSRQDTRFTVSREFVALMREFREKHEKKIDPQGFVNNALEQFGFQKGSMQDLFEFYENLIARLGNKDIAQEDDKVKITLYKHNNEEIKGSYIESLLRPVVYDEFNGFEKVFYILINPEGQKSSDLQSLINTIYGPSQSHCIVYLPEYLVFANSARAQEGLTFPLEGLQVPYFPQGPQGNEELVTYDLKAVAAFSGAHTTTFARHGRWGYNEWYFFNDQTVKAQYESDNNIVKNIIDFQIKGQVSGYKPQLIFYERRRPVEMPAEPVQAFDAVRNLASLHVEFEILSKALEKR